MTTGKHSYIVVPSVTRSPLEAHPFTFAGMPAKDGKVYLIAKARDGAYDRPCHTPGAHMLTFHLASQVSQSVS
jgi:hypothetical protein